MNCSKWKLLGMCAWNRDGQLLPFLPLSPPIYLFFFFKKKKNGKVRRKNIICMYFSILNCIFLKSLISISLCKTSVLSLKLDSNDLCREPLNFLSFSFTDTIFLFKMIVPFSIRQPIQTCGPIISALTQERKWSCG